MKTKWNEKSAADKIILVLRIVISLVVLVGAALQLTGVWDKALNVAVPLLSMLILIQSIQEHREQKKASAIVGYICFVAIVVMIIGAML
ncbi:MAG: hypothetical protein E7613_08510 [Ruminococcaceae bacterium]|nr:hypothetical protein [Oscillospiraceae bacterium]